MTGDQRDAEAAGPCDAEAADPHDAEAADPHDAEAADPHDAEAADPCDADSGFHNSEGLTLNDSQPLCIRSDHFESVPVEDVRVEDVRVEGERVEGERVEGERVEGERVEDVRVEGEHAESQHIVHLVVEWIAVAVVSLALALVLRTFIVQAFFIPSISMHPTLHIGDRIVVDKVGYRFRDVSRGDIVVFSRPETTSDIKELIKRVVAVGGDTFEISEGGVRINGVTLNEAYLQPSVVTLPKSVMHGCANAAMSDLCEVPEGMILVLGDNREASQDSRFFGPVDVDTVVGRAFIRVWPPGSVGGI